MPMTPDEQKLARKERNRRYRQKNKNKLDAREKERRMERKEYFQDYWNENKTLARDRPFIGCDGEGRNLDNGYHAYFMLRIGDVCLYPRPGEVRLRTIDCLEFFAMQDPENVYVGYFFDYDVTKILEDLPWHKLERLIRRETRKSKQGYYFPVDWDDYEIDYLPRKEFKVRRKSGKWVVLHDVGTFFQTRFLDTLIAWEIGTQEDWDAIGEGKDLRADFATIEDAYIDKYNELECILLAQLMTKFRDTCYEVGYVPRKWQGPGLIAEAMLEAHGIPKTADLEIFNDAGEYSLGAFGRYAYYGGWFETGYVGFTNTPTLQFDINSAYPAALQHVPCLLHGEWERVSGKRYLEPGEVSIVFGTFRWDGSKRVMYGGLPIRRDDGSIYHPLNGKGWYWSFEVESAIHQQFTVYDSYVYHEHCSCTPFEFLRDVYTERKRMGKSAKGIYLKLGINSVYGKLVQSIGSPKYSNPVWGSFITAWTRKMINDAIHSLPACTSDNPRMPCGQDVYMVATDAIFTYSYPDEDIKLDIGSGLGQWERDEHSNGLFIIQPGMYFDPAGSNSKTTYKTRGVPKRMVLSYRDEFLQAFDRMLRSRKVSDGNVSLPYTQFMGIRQAIHRRSTKLLGAFVSYEDPETGKEGRVTSFAWKTKRRPQPLPALLDDVKHIRTAPYWGTHDETTDGRPVQTVPYSKDIGGLKRRTELRLDFQDQPDWMM